MATLEDLMAVDKPQDDYDDIDKDILRLSTDEIANRVKLIENELKVRWTRVLCKPGKTNIAGAQKRTETFGTRTNGAEGANQGQQGENQDEQATALPGCKHCRGTLPISESEDGN